MKYLLWGFAGLGIGLVLGVIAGSIYTSHVYDVTVQANPVREDDWRPPPNLPQAAVFMPSGSTHR